MRALAIIALLSTAAHAEPPYTAQERDTLADGEIDESKALLAGGLVGFGFGELVADRYTRTGWIFTVVDVIGWTGVGIGMSRGTCEDAYCDWPKPYNHTAAASLVVLAASHVLQVLDVSSAATERNAQIHAIRARHGLHVAPIVAPRRDGVVAGLTMRF
jgi:hypothetical protein